MASNVGWGDRGGTPGSDILAAGEEFVPTIRWEERGEAILDGPKAHSVQQGSITYGVAKKWLTSFDLSQHHIKNTQHFVELAKSIQLQWGNGCPHRMSMPFSLWCQ